MLSKPVIAGLLVSGCLTAAAGGAYVAVRHNDAARTAAATLDVAAQPVDESAAGTPVAETEGVIETQPKAKAPAPEPPASRPAERPASGAARPPAPERRPAPRPTGPATRSVSTRPATPEPVRARVEPVAPAPEPIAARPAPAAAVPPVETFPVESPAELARLPEIPAAPELIEVVVPASAVIGLRLDRQISSETAQLEDPIEARVTRDVLAGGQLAIPSGSRVLGSVTMVERGGKVKEQAHLGIRFHTLVLADGTRVPLRTETITREGDPVGGESARKIGGAAVGGAILGAILGGGKGAVIGGATGAGAGTAAVMAGGRNPAVLQAGSIVTARLSSPVNIQVEKEQ